GSQSDLIVSSLKFTNYSFDHPAGHVVNGDRCAIVLRQPEPDNRLPFIRIRFVLVQGKCAIQWCKPERYIEYISGTNVCFAVDDPVIQTHHITQRASVFGFCYDGK